MKIIKCEACKGTGEAPSIYTMFKKWANRPRLDCPVCHGKGEILMRTKTQAKAMSDLGFDPFALGAQLEQWCKAFQWHGAPAMRKLLVKAGFNYKLMEVHLQGILKRLNADH